MTYLLEDLQAFLQDAPTSWHAVEEMGNRLAALDFIPLNETEKWHLQAGKSYFVVRGGSLIAFRLPSHKPRKAAVLAAHTDSPALKIKPNPQQIVENMALLGVEYYGAPIAASWMGRDLALAGRIVVETSSHKIEEKLIFIDESPLIIAPLALHLDREVNEKGLAPNPQTQLNAICALQEDNGEKNVLETLLRRHLSFNHLLSFDLFLVPADSARFIGIDGEMIASYRLDNLASAHAALAAIGQSQNGQDTIQIAALWDHEEIGSATDSGAESDFLVTCLKRMSFLSGLNVEEQEIFLRNSFCISLDVAHGFHPNYPDKYDSNHRPLLGKGIAIKYHGQMRYVTNAPSASAIIQLCRTHNLPYQLFAYRSDMKAGSTVGPLLAKQLGMTTVDIGCPLLSMHAAREIISTRDYLEMVQLLTHFYQSSEK